MSFRVISLFCDVLFFCVCVRPVHFIHLFYVWMQFSIRHNLQLYFLHLLLVLPPQSLTFNSYFLYLCAPSYIALIFTKVVQELHVELYNSYIQPQKEAGIGITASQRDVTVPRVFAANYILLKTHETSRVRETWHSFPDVSSSNIASPTGPGDAQNRTGRDKQGIQILHSVCRLQINHPLRTISSAVSVELKFRGKKLLSCFQIRSQIFPLLEFRVFGQFFGRRVKKCCNWNKSRCSDVKMILSAIFGFW